MTEVLVLGGGPAGLTAAKSLAARGVGVVLVERSESLGGRAREWTCKGLSECRNCGVCYAVDSATEVLTDGEIEVFLLSEISSVLRTEGRYSVKIKASPRYVTDDCIGCGKCAEVCPVDGKAVFAPTGSGQPRTYWIDRARCLHFKRNRCDKCATVCPTKAIDYEDRARTITREADAIVLATGIEPVEASEVSRFGSDTLKDVISSVDAERMLNARGRLARPSDGRQPKKIAIIQCVGSRSVKQGVEYCSKFCCKYATKIAQLLLDIDPETSLDFYFMDLSTLYEPQDEFKLWAKGKKTVRLIRSMPAAVFEGKEGRVAIRAASETDLEIMENEYDLVILSVGMRPYGVNSELAKTLGISMDPMGFAVPDDSLERSGIFVCGAVSAPMDIEEAAVRATALAARIACAREAGG